MMKYNEFLSTFKECSYDSDNNVFLVDNETACFDLDKYFICKFKELDIGDRPKSLDSIYSQTSNFSSKCLFVEFKNQSIKNLSNKSYSLYSKIFNSLLIFIGDNHYCIEDCATRNYLLIVYSNYKDKISGQLFNLTYRIEQFKKYCFKDVKFITNLEFDDYITKFDCLSND